VEITCPKCGRKGKVRVIKQKKVQNTYKYVVIDHENTKHSVDKDAMVEIIEKLLDENWQLKMRVAELEKENSELRERVVRLEAEKGALKSKADLYDEIVEHSAVIRRTDAEKLDEIKRRLEAGEILAVRVIAYREERRIVYADIR